MKVHTSTFSFNESKRFITNKNILLPCSSRGSKEGRDFRPFRIKVLHIMVYRGCNTPLPFDEGRREFLVFTPPPCTSFLPLITSPSLSSFPSIIIRRITLGGNKGRGR